MSCVALSWLSVQGADAATFLQGQLTNDVLALDGEHWQLSAHCSALGKVLFLGYLLRCPGGFLFGSAQAEVETQLRRYLLRSQVVLAPTKLKTWVVASAASSTARTLHATAQGWQLSGFGDWALWVSEQEPAAFASPEGYAAATLKMGLPELSAPTVNLFLPQLLGLEAAGALSFSKGCYIGQENIARLRYKSSVKQGLAYALQAEPGAQPGAALFDAQGQRAGTVLRQVGAAVQAVIYRTQAGVPLRREGSPQELFFTLY